MARFIWFLLLNASQKQSYLASMPLLCSLFLIHADMFLTTSLLCCLSVTLG